MLGSFKLRMLLVIFIVTIVGLSIQSQHNSKNIIEPVIKYILKDYGLEKNIAVFVKNITQSENETIIPATGKRVLQIPCDFSKIKTQYGWYWNIEEKKQEFCPGVKLEVQENSLVRPVCEGQVIEISADDEGRTVLIKHDQDFYSFYGCLKEIMVDQDMVVPMNTVIGKAGNCLYFEIRNQDGPLNPNILFE